MPLSNRLIVCVAMAPLLVGCATRQPPPDHKFNDPAYISDTEQRLNEADAAARLSYDYLGERALRDAYANGVADTMMEFRGRTHGRQGFVWEPPLVEWVETPARTVNGFVRPSHVEPVIISPGRWIEEHSVQLPLPNGSHIPQRVTPNGDAVKRAPDRAPPRQQ